MKKTMLLILLMLCLVPTAFGCAAAAEPIAPIDIDLSGMSATMAYAQAYEMLVNPNDYIGKRISIRGGYYDFTDPDTGQVYTAVIITDNTLCCELGLEFILGDGCVYPQDYPTVGDIVTVTGVFSTYTEGEQLYCHLTDGVLD